MHFVLLSLSFLLVATAAVSRRALLSRDQNRTRQDVSTTSVAIPPAVPAAARHDNNVADLPFPTYPDVRCASDRTVSADNVTIIDHHFSTTLSNAGPDGFRAFEQGGGALRHGPADASVVGFVINYSYRPFKMDIAQFRAALLELQLRCAAARGSSGPSGKRLGSWAIACGTASDTWRRRTGWWLMGRLNITKASGHRIDKAAVDHGQDLLLGSYLLLNIISSNHLFVKRV